MPKKKEKIIEAVIDEEYEKSFFTPRLIAFLIDMIIIVLISSCILYMLPKNDNYDKYVKEYEIIQYDLYNQKITVDEFINQSIDVVYDIDYNNVPTLIIDAVLCIGYFIIFQFYNKGQTLGKKLMKIKVVSTNGKPLNMNQLAIRSLFTNEILLHILLIGFLLFVGRNYYFYLNYGTQFLQLIFVAGSLILILFRKDGKGIHDLITSTMVVKS